MAYTITTTGKLVCLKCGNTSFMLEGSVNFIETTCADECPFDPVTCGLRDGETFTSEDSAFVALWTKLTGSPPEPYGDW